MAKGGLDPGADPTIVAAAYRAGMAGVPQDLSKTFQGIATGYTKAMDKMGAGLAKAAEVGTSIAAPLIEQSIQNYKTMTSEASSVSVDDYGQSFIDSIYGVNGEGGWLNELKEEKQAWKKGVNEDGSTMTTAQKKEAKRKWKQKRDKGFAHIRQLQKGEFLNTSLIAEGDWNPEATGSENALLHSAIQMKGKPLPEGHRYAGVSVKSVIGEDGGVSLQLTNDDGTLEYHSEQGVVTTSYDFGGDYGFLSAKSKSLSGSGLERIHEETANDDGSQRTQKEMMDSGFQGDYHEIQRDLKALYPNHDFGTTGDNGDGIDGKWGDKTQAAYEMYLRDKDKLETEWLDENLTDEKIEELNIENDYNIQRATTTTPSTTKPLTVTPENIEKLIVPKDYKMRTNVTKVHDTELQNGYKGWDFQENDVRRQLNENIRTSAQLSDAMHAPFGNSDGTYAEYLGKPNAWTQEMYSVLENMSGIQDIGEPGIDADDFAGEQGAANMAVLRKEMLNVNNPSSKKMFIDWQTEEIRKQHTTGKARYHKEQRSKGSGKTTNPYEYKMHPVTGLGVSGPDRLNKRNMILSGQDFAGQMGNWKFNKETGMYTGENIEGGDPNQEFSMYEVMNKEDIARAGDQSIINNIYKDAYGVESTAGGGKLTNIEPKMFRGTEKEVVKSFNDDPRFKGYKFTTEWEMGGRAMNIIIGNKEEIIMLDERDAAAKILKFMNNNPTTSTQQTKIDTDKI